ncbi:thioether cross-link-forming SCIFF peptide maturase [Selenomonas caprae]|uniref:Thioether cross-link-forming SCIFF peptide maturase n=1 Tax=Selenomonas caprae TaxID=2606905 RepID=A0A5D6WR17_9FIRM|nr:thioether cross-link-forming SCIFF peptide maturase [Selenomonas caprae]TYZ31011.1 thioether cross-link-forming SCIFF peptide maturase [Selenomonas caprae]
MKARIHKFEQNGTYILLDINSGAVHVIDKMIYDMMDTFDGTNDDAVRTAMAGEYPQAEVDEALSELHALMDAGELFAPDINVPPTFKQTGLVKSICLMIAQDCNLRCKYCFGDGGSYGQERAIMTPEVGKKAVDYLIKASGPRKHLEMDFFGGEPLMNMKTVKAVTEYARQREKETGKKFKLTMTTNGILLNDENIQWLNDNDFALVLSLDGRKEVHDAMRPLAGGQGSYDRAIANFKKCLASRKGGDYDYRGVYTYLRGTYTKNNMDFTKDVLSMNDEGFDILSMEPVVLKDSPLGFTEEDLPRIREEYDRLTEAYMKRHREGKGFFFFHFNMDLSNGPCVAKRLSGCGAGHEYVAVAENGDLYPCHQFVGREKYKIGTVDTGITDKETSQYFRESHVLNKEQCSECWSRFFCSGGCHANADLFHNDIRKPYEVGCEIQKKRLECAIYVQALLELEKMDDEEPQDA